MHKRASQIQSTLPTFDCFSRRLYFVGSIIIVELSSLIIKQNPMLYYKKANRKAVIKKEKRSTEKIQRKQVVNTKTLSKFLI